MRLLPVAQRSLRLPYAGQTSAGNMTRSPIFLMSSIKKNTSSYPIPAVRGMQAKPCASPVSLRQPDCRDG